MRRVVDGDTTYRMDTFDDRWCVCCEHPVKFQHLPIPRNWEFVLREYLTDQTDV